MASNLFTIKYPQIYNKIDYPQSFFDDYHLIITILYQKVHIEYVLYYLLGDYTCEGLFFGGRGECSILVEFLRKI